MEESYNSSYLVLPLSPSIGFIVPDVFILDCIGYWPNCTYGTSQYQHNLTCVLANLVQGIRVRICCNSSHDVLSVDTELCRQQLYDLSGYWH